MSRGLLCRAVAAREGYEYGGSALGEFFGEFFGEFGDFKWAHPREERDPVVRLDETFNRRKVRVRTLDQAVVTKGGP